MERAIGYIRVSTEGQATEGVSLEAQQAKIAALREVHDYELGQVYEDAGVSRSRAYNRPGLQSDIDGACKAKAALVVYSLSRLARSTKDAITISERLAKSGADLVSLSERIDPTSASGKMVFRMLAVLAEFERDQISERTTAALAHKKSKGQRVGNCPYGWRPAPDGVHLEKDPSEQRTVAVIRSLRHETKLTLQGIRSQLEAMGLRNRNGSLKWRLNTISEVAKREEVANATA